MNGRVFVALTTTAEVRFADCACACGWLAPRAIHLMGRAASTVAFASAPEEWDVTLLQVDTVELKCPGCGVALKLTVREDKMKRYSWVRVNDAGGFQGGVLLEADAVDKEAVGARLRELGVNLDADAVIEVVPIDHALLQAVLEEANVAVAVDTLVAGQEILDALELGAQRTAYHDGRR